MTNVLLFFFVLVLTAVGVVVLGVDLKANAQLHFLNATVGGGSLVLAVALALPLRVKDALAELIPAVSAIRKVGA